MNEPMNHGMMNEQETHQMVVIVPNAVVGRVESDDLSRFEWEGGLLPPEPGVTA